MLLRLSSSLDHYSLPYVLFFFFPSDIFLIISLHIHTLPSVCLMKKHVLGWQPVWPAMSATCLSLCLWEHDFGWIYRGEGGSCIPHPGQRPWVSGTGLCPSGWAVLEQLKKMTILCTTPDRILLSIHVAALWEHTTESVNVLYYIFTKPSFTFISKRSGFTCLNKGMVNITPKIVRKDYLRFLFYCYRAYVQSSKMKFRCYYYLFLRRKVKTDKENICTELLSS